MASRIANDLRKRDIQVWFAEEEIQPGMQWADAISEAVKRADAVLVLVSNQTGQGRWQDSEIALAIATQRSNPEKKLIPVLVEELATMPFFLRSRVYLDLSTEKAYPEGIDLLVETLFRPSESGKDVRESDHREVVAIKAQRTALAQSAAAMFHEQATRQLAVIATVVSTMSALVAFAVGTFAITEWAPDYSWWMVYIGGGLVASMGVIIAWIVYRRIWGKFTRKGARYGN